MNRQRCLIDRATVCRAKTPQDGLNHLALLKNKYKIDHLYLSFNNSGCFGAKRKTVAKAKHSEICTLVKMFTVFQL